ncbi:MAG: type II toxin-antitoxin system RelE family toxin [Xanthobacteraceae bacterium]|jgi:mRNA interferase RelE/StbE
MELRFSPAAVRALARMPKREAGAILRKLKAVAAEPFGDHPWAKRLKSEDCFRARQGDWRAVYKVDTEYDAVIVERVEHRREVYR